MMKTTRMINISPFDDIVIQCDTLYNLYWNVYHVYLSICCRNIFLEPKSHGSPKKGPCPTFWSRDCLAMPMSMFLAIRDRTFMRMKNVVHHLLNAAICSRSMLILNMCCVSTCFV